MTDCEIHVGAAKSKKNYLLFEVTTDKVYPCICHMAGYKKGCHSLLPEVLLIIISDGDSLSQSSSPPTGLFVLLLLLSSLYPMYPNYYRHLLQCLSLKYTSCPVLCSSQVEEQAPLPSRGSRKLHILQEAPRRACGRKWCPGVA